MENIEKKLQSILTYLLSQSGVSASLRDELEQLAADPEGPALLARLERLLSQQADPEWLEALAAASEGFILPEVAEFLSRRDTLTQIEPDLADQSEILLQPIPADDLAAWAAFPTFIEQFEAQQLQPVALKAEQEAGGGWKQGVGFQWRQLKEKGQVVIRVAAEAFNNAKLNLAGVLQPPAGPLAYSGQRARGVPKILLQLELKEVEDLEVTVVAEADQRQPDYCSLTVSVDIPSRGGWPHLGEVEIALKRGELALQTEVTDAFGQAVFEEIAVANLTELVFEIAPYS